MGVTDFGNQHFFQKMRVIGFVNQHFFNIPSENLFVTRNFIEIISFAGAQVNGGGSGLSCCSNIISSHSCKHIYLKKKLPEKILSENKQKYIFGSMWRLALALWVEMRTYSTADRGYFDSMTCP